MGDSGGGLGLLFPGQGSQKLGMGLLLAQSDSAAASVFEEADDILGFSLSGLCWEGPEEELTLTKNAQPALLTHSVAVLRSCEHLLGDVRVAAGHSLGEFSAYVAAGTLSFADALRAVRVRGELMFESGTVRPGTMAAILGLSGERIETVCSEASQNGAICVAANFNSDGQVVISGDVPGVERACELAKAAGAKRALMLNVSGAFHSPLMASARDGLANQLNLTEFRDPAFPVVSNVTAEAVTDAALAKTLLIDQLTSAVRWQQSAAEITARGGDRLIEMGPGSVLAGLSKRNAPGTPTISVGAPSDLEAIGDWLATTESLA